MGRVNEPVRPDDIRVSDTERTAVQRHLHWAHGEGLLDLGEFDERASALWSAKTRGELAALTRDLPAPAGAASPGPAAQKQVFSDTGGGTAMRVLAIVFGSIVTVNVVVWGLVSATSGLTYPWFVWTVLPLVVLGVLYVAGVGRPDRPG